VDLTKKDWLDYINKLQQREKDKISSGGMSNWVLIVTNGSIAFYLYNQIPVIKSEYKLTLIGFVFSVNIITSFFDIINAEYRSDKVESYRKEQNSDLGRRINRLFVAFELPVLAISIALNILAIFFYGSFTYVFIVFIYRHSMNLYSNFARRKEMNHKVNERTLKIARRIILSIIFLVSVSPLFFGKLWIMIDSSLLQFILNGFYILVIFVLVQFLFGIFAKRMKISWLQEIEHQFMMGRIDEEQLKIKLDTEYFTLSNIEDLF
jgi:hypothetical protein